MCTHLRQSRAASRRTRRLRRARSHRGALHRLRRRRRLLLRLPPHPESDFPLHHRQPQRQQRGAHLGAVAPSGRRRGLTPAPAVTFTRASLQYALRARGVSHREAFLRGRHDGPEPIHG